MRRFETGGFLLGVVAVMAVATFAYIGFMLARDPQKAETVSEGIEEATETTEVVAATEATAESQALHDRYVALGYPDDAALPAEFVAEILVAYESGKLPVVDQLAHGDDGNYAVIVSAAEIGAPNPNYCGLYGQDVCFLLYHDDEGTEVLTVFDAIRGSPQATMGSPILEEFLGDGSLLVVAASGDGPEVNEKGYAVVPGSPGNVFEVAAVSMTLSPPLRATVSVRGEAEHALTFAMEETGQKVAGDLVITDMRIAVSDDSGDLGVLEGSYNADTETAVSVDYAKTFSDSLFVIDDRFGINVWVLGTLYRYDGSTFTEVTE
ncbi:hypothetical protein HYS28_03280 [Candidatus Uhrbacteria bacterium]|nr:hypothetical protein [Candidatus Uhrbacteria bacterium]